MGLGQFRGRALGLFILALSLLSCSSQRGTKGLAVSKLAFGPRAGALGEAFVGQSDDVTAVYWNPAGLSQMDSSEILFTHQARFVSSTENYASFAYPLGSRAFGAALFLSQSSNIESWDEEDQRGEDFHTSTTIFYFAYGQRLNLPVYLGGSFKFLYENLYKAKGIGIGCDLGVLYKPNSQLNLGLRIQNLGFSAASGLSAIAFTLGCGYHPVRAPGLNILSDIRFPIDNIPSFHLGTEYWIRGISAIRFGFKTGPQSIGGLGIGSMFTFGLGLKYENFILDYAIVPYGELGVCHRIGLGHRFSVR